MIDDGEWMINDGWCHPERSNVVAESIYETSQLVDLVELGSKEQDPVTFQ